MKTKIGIIGGGQLALMLATNAVERGLDVNVLSENHHDPAVQVAKNWIKAQSDQISAVEKLALISDVITFESEFVSAAVLQRLAEKSFKQNYHCHAYPASRLMKKLSDRLSQKQLLEKHQIPTAPYVAVSDSAQLNKALTGHHEPKVLKSRLHGYDGKGTYIQHGGNLKGARDFVKTSTSGCIAEDFVPFKREIAISLARSQKGEIVTYPFVETKQENYRCLWVKGPIDANSARFRTLKSKLKKFVERIDYVGVISFEIFDTGTHLLINEIAPRVHNSAHYSQDCMSVSQFELHIRAILGLPLEQPRPLGSGFAMMNLIGTSTKLPQMKFVPGIKHHWYRKTENRPGRKMGHLNSLGSSPEAALKKVSAARKEWKL